MSSFLNPTFNLLVLLIQYFTFLIYIPLKKIIKNTTKHTLLSIHKQYELFYFIYEEIEINQKYTFLINILRVLIIRKNLTQILNNKNLPITHTLNSHGRHYTQSKFLLNPNLQCFMIQTDGNVIFFLLYPHSTFQFKLYLNIFLAILSTSISSFYIHSFFSNHSFQVPPPSSTLFSF